MPNPRVSFPPLNQGWADGVPQCNEAWGGYFRSNSRSLNKIFQPNIVCLGDSRTKGAYVYGSGAYPAQLGAALGVSVLNLGENGATTGGASGTPSVLAQVAAALAAYNANFSNIACLFPGVNDAGLGVALGTVEANYISIVSQLQAGGFRVMAMTIAPSNYASYPNPSYLAEVASINSFLWAGGSGADIVCNVANNPRLANPADTTYFNSDQLHFVAAGYAVIAQNVRAVLGALLGP